MWLMGEWSGEPATLGHWRRHTLGVCVATTLSWVLAHFIARNLFA